jgi:hypothetical protein
VLAWLGQAREPSEYWIHRQQILPGLGRPSDLRADLAGPVFDELGWACPYRLAQAPYSPGDTVTITINGLVTKTWHLVAAESGWQFGDQPGTRLAASDEYRTGLRLLTNNLKAGGRTGLAASGDGAITGILLRARAGIGTPERA